MYHFAVSLHARSEQVSRGGTPLVRGDQIFSTLITPPEALAETFTRTFEETAAALERLEGLYIEPDGSFVWTSRAGEEPWQVDGHLYDRNNRLLLVDLKGNCPAHRFDDLLKSVGWPQTRVMFQLVREAKFLDDMEMRRWATT